MVLQLPNGSVGEVLSIYPYIEAIGVVHDNVIRYGDVAYNLEEATGIIVNLADGVSVIIGNLKNEDITYILDSLFVEQISFDSTPYDAVKVTSSADFIGLNGKTYYQYIPRWSMEELPYF